MLSVKHSSSYRLFKQYLGKYFPLFVSMLIFLQIYGKDKHPARPLKYII